MAGAASCAVAAASLRGNARNGMPKAFTKQAAAKAAVKARSAPAIGNIRRVRLRSQERHGVAHGGRGFLRGGRRLAARQRQKRDAEGFHKTGRGQGGGLFCES